MSFRGSICFGIPNQNLLKTLNRPFKIVKIEFSLSLAEDDLSNEILWWQKSNEAVVLITICI